MGGVLCLLVVLCVYSLFSFLCVFVVLRVVLSADTCFLPQRAGPALGG